MKLYVLLDLALSEAQRAVQGGHAVAALLLQGNHGAWRNGTLVYLGSKNLERDIYKLQRKGCLLTLFREPDLGNRVTAAAAVSDGYHFKKYRLIS